MHNSVLAALFAFLSASTIAWGTVVRHRIAESSPASGGGTLRAALRQPLWWAGLSTALLAYFLQAVALGFGTLLIVQPILVLKLMLTLPLSALYAHRRLSSREVGWSLVLTVAVVILVTVGRPLPGQIHPPLLRWIPALVVGIVAMLALGWTAQGPLRRHRSLLLGSITGVLYGYVAVLSKAAVDVFAHQGFWGLIHNWEPLSVLGAAVVGTIIQHYAFQAGSLNHCLPAMTIGEPIVAFALGYLILAEKFQVAGWGWLLMAAALLAMAAATVALTRTSISQPRVLEAAPPLGVPEM